MILQVNFRWYQHVLAPVKGPDDLLSDHPFREADLEHDFVLPSERKILIIPAKLKTVAVRAAMSVAAG